jgi:hypothetical protein
VVGSNGTGVGVWDVSAWDVCVWPAGGEGTWDVSTWDNGDTFADETTGHVGYWDYDHWRRCEFAD